MARSALAVFICLLLVFFGQTPAQAQSGNNPGASKKHAKKSAALKRNAAASTGTRRANGRVYATIEPRDRRARKVMLANGKRRMGYHRIAYAPALIVPSAGDLAGLNLTHDPLELKSNVAFVIDQSSAQILFEKNSNVALPIASITKLMTGLVVVEAKQNLDEVIEITADDIDKEKNSRSRLRVGATLTRNDLLHIALMSSENRAASALGRNYPGGLPAFVAAMNAKAKALGMSDTRYVDSSGLSSHNVASARDLAKLVGAAYQHPMLRQYSTDPKYVVEASGHPMQYGNSNRLVGNPDWEIGLQKTGYISEAGRCLVMQAKIEGRAIVMVFLDSKGKLSRLADADRIRKWLESVKTPEIAPHDPVPRQS